VDGRRETNPAGVLCRKLEAHYKLIIGRSSIRRDIVKSISALPEKELAGIIVSPLALADAMLSGDEKIRGCALVDFGAGVTSVSIYKNGDLLNMSVIPLGGNLITRDIISLKLTESNAENVKIEYGSAILKDEDEDEVITVSMEGSEEEIELKDLNAIIEGRAKEIVENVYARISEVTDIKSLNAGIVLAGGASELRRLPELIKERCKVKVRPSAIRGELVQDSDEMLGNPLYMTAISLMLKGSAQCVFQVATPGNDENENKESEDENNKTDEPQRGIFKRKKKAPKEKKKSDNGSNSENETWWGKFFDES
jgi:cell division protein FtsA